MMGAYIAVYARFTKQDYFFLISVLLTLLGMIQDYLDKREGGESRGEGGAEPG